MSKRERMLVESKDDRVYHNRLDRWNAEHEYVLSVVILAIDVFMLWEFFRLIF